MNKIEKLTAMKESKEKELRILERELETARLEDIESRFHLKKGSWYKTKDDCSCDTVYFKYTDGVYIRDGYLQGPYYIRESLGKAFHKIELGKPFYLRLQKDPDICFNAASLFEDKALLSPLSFTGKEVSFEEVSEDDVEDLMQRVEEWLTKWSSKNE